MKSQQFLDKGWCHFDYDENISTWLGHALPAARAEVASTANDKWLRCGGTWFAGVNVLPNNSLGSVNGSGPLQGAAVDFIFKQLAINRLDWDQGQVSVCYPGYPKPMSSESPAAFRYRRDRDAAHVDGLLPEGPSRRRYLREYHGFILGIPMVEFSADACPFIVWEGSHEWIRSALMERFDGVPPHSWRDEDVTQIYHQTRREVFDNCPRISISARPGEAFLVHRLMLHGVAPWAPSAVAGKDGRMICYFRPTHGGPANWLNDP
tara:strand:+ start:316 stop:1107 length:792 start_codon:yes stop_codon:yes gene_type:complete